MALLNSETGDVRAHAPEDERAAGEALVAVLEPEDARHDLERFLTVRLAAGERVRLGLDFGASRLSAFPFTLAGRSTGPWGLHPSLLLERRVEGTSPARRSRADLSRVEGVLARGEVSGPRNASVVVYEGHGLPGMGSRPFRLTWPKRPLDPETLSARLEARFPEARLLWIGCCQGPHRHLSHVGVSGPGFEQLARASGRPVLAFHGAVRTEALSVSRAWLREAASITNPAALVAQTRRALRVHPQPDLAAEWHRPLAVRPIHRSAPAAPLPEEIRHAPV